MGYVDDNLVAGERVLYRARLHVRVYALAALLGVVALALVVAALTGPETAEIPLLVVAAVLGVGAAAAGARAAIQRRSHEFTVTDKRVVIKTGLVQRHTVETLLSKIENIQVEQGLVGRLLGFGTLELTGTGGTKEVFPDIAAPLEFRRQVQAATLALDAQRAVADVRDERECPFCAERVLARAKVCRFCGRDLPAAVVSGA